MVSQYFRLNALKFSLCVAPGSIVPAFAAECYQGSPVAVSSSVKPNVLFYIDASSSMSREREDDSSSSGSGDDKLSSAKRVAKKIVTENDKARFGLFSFKSADGDEDDRDRDEDHGSKRQCGTVKSEVKDMDDVTKSSLTSDIDKFTGNRSTPIGQGLLDATRYFEGKNSLYCAPTAAPPPSPIQYRCQKNVVIVITDGKSCGDDDLPGDDRGRPEISYVARDCKGKGVAKSFRVCKAPDYKDDDGMSVTCPDGLEKQDGSYAPAPSGYAQGSCRYRGMRDVAKYARVADLKCGGKDKDGKDFDEPKFAGQNMTTYTVNLGAANPVLEAAATAGGGKYFNATSEASLADAVTQSIQAISSSISNSGGLATLTDAVSAGNKIFQPIFNPNGWYGELRCLTIAADGSVGAPCAIPKALIPGVSTRKVFTSKVASGATMSFVFSSANIATMTTAQKSALGVAAADQTNTIDFIRGVEGIAGFRSRYSPAVLSTVLLGDIVNGKPEVVTKPSGSTSDAAYATFASTNANRNMVLVGANDGMMHAFDIASMSELAAYIPSAVYPRLKALTHPNYGTDTVPHTFHVNGTMRQQDIKVGGTWKTIVVGSLGEGGQGYYAVDATNSTNFNLPSESIKWEWTDITDSDMGYTLATPLIYNVRNGSNSVIPAVIVANGYESNWDDTASGGQKSATKNSALYILNANTGALIREISVPSTVASPSNGLSSPAGVDVGQDGILDYVYAGDVNGKIWRFDLTDHNPSAFKVSANPIFNAGATDPNKATPLHPITKRPAVMPVYAKDGSPLGNMILFGTGKLLTDADRSDTNQQTIYGVLDKMERVPNTVTLSQLVQQSFSTNFTPVSSGDSDPTRAGTYRQVTQNSVDLATKLGWYINLPEESERMVISPLVFEDKVIFGSGSPKTSEACLPGGTGWIIGLNPLTGSVTRRGNQPTGADYSFIDIDGDGAGSSADKLSFPTSLVFPATSAYMSAYQVSGIPGELSVVDSSSKVGVPVFLPGSDTLARQGHVIALREANSMGVYTGNPVMNGKNSDASRGTPINRPRSLGKGYLYGGTFGDDSITKEQLISPGAAVVKATTWREIK